MKTKQENRLNMYLAVRNFVIPNEEVAKTVPNFMTNYAIVQNTIAEIQSVAEFQRTDKTGLALGKNKQRELLIVMAAENSSIVLSYAKSIKNDLLLSEAKFKESDLSRLSDVALKDSSMIIYNKAEENISNLAEYGITPETQAEFLKAINSFNISIQSPRHGINEKSQATKKIPELFKKADDAIENMDFAVNGVKRRLPDFYNGYRSARVLVDLGTGRLALKATVRDRLTGEPVRGVSFSFLHDGMKAAGTSGNGEISKKSAEKGRLQIKSMPSGNYKVVISKPGYKDKEAVVSIGEGERSEMVVELEKI